MDKLYRIGLDVGIGSVGWAVLENNAITEEPVRILKMGVRTFSPNEVDKTGESSSKARREQRGCHRRNRRRNFRTERIKKLLANTFGINALEDVSKLNNVDVYKLRATALNERLSNAEICKVVLNICKRRGFLSNRKNIQSKEEGILLKAISENTQFLQEKNYRTIGEAIYLDNRFKVKSCGHDIYNVRNHAGDYKNCFCREDLKNELIILLEKQKDFGNNNISKEMIDKIVYIFEKQRNFDEGPGNPSPYSAKFEIGHCGFLKDELRAPKASYTFELFTSLSKINSLKINEECISQNQKQILIDFIITKKELKFEQVRKLLNVPNDKTFNLCRYTSKKNQNLSEEEIISSSEKSVFVSMKNSYDIATKLGVGFFEGNQDLFDEIAFMLSTCKSDSTIDEYIKTSEILKDLNDIQIDAIKTLNFDKFGSLSIKAMKQIIPYLFKGDRYDIACKKAGFNHSSFEQEKLKYLKGSIIEEKLKDVTSNVVKRAINQTLRILNQIIKEFGSPQYVTIELSRELSKDASERRRLEKIQQENFISNEKSKEYLTNEFKLSKPSSFDVIKLKLYQEQDGKCIYSGKSIDINRLYEPNYVQVDHILPYSRSFDDSFNNKVLVLCSENQNKGDRTPYEFFGQDKSKWNNFVDRVNLLKNRNKKQYLLKENFGEEQQKSFKERNLNDTKYMSKFLFNLFQSHLKMTPSKKYTNVVCCVNGKITSYLRKFWGINKIREDGDVHHAIDAVIISTVTAGQIQKLTQYNKLRESYIKVGDYFVNKKTGEKMSQQQKEEYEKIDAKIFSKQLPPPYDEFIKELKIRSRIDYNHLNFTEQEKLELALLGYSEQDLQQAKPIFVSKMKNVKFTGPIHRETMMSSREYQQTKRLIKSIPIQKLTIDNVHEEIPLKEDKYPEFSISNYYRPQDDRLLYLKLKNYLIENKCKNIPDDVIFYKPKKDGTDGPIVKNVKVYEKSSSCVVTKNGAGVNEKMHRIDLFKKDNKFYLCPVYMSDVYAKKLPNKIIEINKDWIEIDDSYEFLFSLYQNDLIKVISNKELSLSKNFKNVNSQKPDKISSNEFLLYYNSTGISGASIKVLTHDNCYKKDSLGVKTLLSIEKYYTDIMGNIYKAPKEQRKEL